MDLFEYQAKELFAEYGVPVQRCRVAASPEEALAETMAGDMRLAGDLITIDCGARFEEVDGLVVLESERSAEHIDPLLTVVHRGLGPDSIRRDGDTQAGRFVFLEMEHERISVAPRVRHRRLRVEPWDGLRLRPARGPSGRGHCKLPRRGWQPYRR